MQQIQRYEHRGNDQSQQHKGIAPANQANHQALPGTNITMPKPVPTSASLTPAALRWWKPPGHDHCNRQ
jgi:hypothetical protein